MNISLRPAGASALALAAAMMMIVSAAPVAAADDEYLPGIDVSHWQGRIDWAAVKADGIQFAVAKATDGLTFVDDQYARNRSQADQVGIYFTAYHFARPDKGSNDARMEADHFVDTAMLRGRHLLPVLDLENTGGLGKRALKRWAKAWVARVEARLGVKSMIYTSPYFWRDNMGDTTWFARNGHALWIAHWGVEQPLVPADNWNGQSWTLWQTSSRGSVSGIDGNVDLDRYNGTDLDNLRIKNNR